jgi:RNA polymerase sigma factor (TIGR02999 family)
MPEVTRLIQAAQAGDRQAAADLLPLVYDELRVLAASKMAREAPGHTLNATGLVHEAYLRLVGDQHFDGRRHFFAAAAEAMRRILIDNARRKHALRHGGGQQRVDMEGIVELAAPCGDDELLTVNEALDKLAVQNKAEAELVKLRYFVGMTLEEAAAALGISARTADNYWAHARAWLFREIKAQRQ